MKEVSKKVIPVSKDFRNQFSFEEADARMGRRICVCDYGADEISIRVVRSKVEHDLFVFNHFLVKTSIFSPSPYCAAVGLADITSANVVGYIGKDSESKKQPSFGACFLPVGGGDTYKLKDLVPSNFDPDSDMICLINPSTLGTDAGYVYMSKEIADAAALEDGEEAGTYDALVGWWDAAGGVGEDGAEAGEVKIDVGQAFLGLFLSGENITFTSSGEVPAKGTSVAISTDGQKQPFFANVIPITIKLKTIVPENFDPDADMICIINPSTLGTDAGYVYMSKEIADAAALEDGEEAGAYDGLVGWWDAAGGVGEDGAEAGEVDVEAGAAFLGLFLSGNDIKFNFASPL